MRYVIGALCAFLGVPFVSAQEVPRRFQDVGKGSPFRLTRVLGTPEMAPAFNPTSVFSTDGKTAVYAEDLTTGTDETPRFRTRLNVWDTQAKTWPLEIDINGKSVTALTLSANGDKAFLAGLTLPEKTKTIKSYLALWDLKSGKEIKSFTTEESPILAVALTVEETVGLTGTSVNLKGWDLVQGRELAVYGEKNKTSTTALVFLPGGREFLSGSQEGAVRLWDIAKPKPIRTYADKGKQFTWWLSLAPDGKRFLAGDLQSSVTLWDIGGKQIGTQQLADRAADEVLLGAAAAGDGKTFVAVWGKPNPAPDDFACAKLIAWDAHANKPLWSKGVPYRGRLPMLVRDDRLLVGGGPNVFDVWNWKEGQRLQSWGGHKGSVNAVALLANGDVVSAGQEGVLMTWRKGQLHTKERAHAGAITTLAVSKDRTRWLSAGGDLVIRHWPMNAIRPKSLPKKHAGPITSVAFSSDGTLAFSGSGDRTAKSWALKSGEELATFAGHAEGVNAVAVSPDGRWLATGSDDTTIRVWPIKAGKPDADRDPIVLEGHKKAVLCLAFSPDGKTLLSGSQDQTLKLWDWENAKVRRTIGGHKNWITSLVFADADTAICTSDDLSICRWDLQSGKELGRVDFGAVGDCPRCLSIHGDRLAVGTSSWLVFEFHVAPPQSKGAVGSSK